MPARLLRLPITSSIPRPALNITPDAWTRIEKSSYRLKFSDALREHIERATVKYVWLAKMEDKAEPLAAAKEILRRISKLRPLVHQLLPDLRGISKCETDAHSLLRHKLGQLFRAPSQHRRPFGDHFGSFILDLAAFSEALNKIGTLETSDCQQHGDAWSGWVNDLTAIIQQAGLRAGVSKDTRCKEDSLFVRFVAAVQKELPRDQFLQPFTELRSLADAIYRARRDRPRAGVVKQARADK